MLPTGTVYMINGFPIPEAKPAPWHLALIWKNGSVNLWPAATLADATAMQERISLRPDLMQRIEVRGEIGFPLWDADWPMDEPGDLLAMPPELSADHRMALMRMMLTRKL